MRTRLSGSGRIWVISHDSQTISKIIEDLGLTNEVYIIESSTSTRTLMSGSVKGFTALNKELDSQKIGHFYNDLSIPWHSRFIEYHGKILTDKAMKQKASEPRLPLYTSANGQAFDNTNYKDFDTGKFWHMVITGKLQFRTAIDMALERHDDCDAFMEISTLPFISGLLKKNLFDLGKPKAVSDNLSNTGRIGIVQLGGEDTWGIIEDLGLTNHLEIIEDSTSVHCLVAGGIDAFNILMKELKSRKIGYIYHGHTIGWHNSKFCEKIKTIGINIPTQPPKIPIYGPYKMIDSSNYQIKTQEFWGNLLTKKIPFDQQVRTVLQKESDCDAFMEISAFPILAGILKRNLFEKGKPKHIIVPSMMHGQENNFDTLMASLAKLSVGGHKIKWEAVYPHGNHRIVQDYINTIIVSKL
eukprot:gene11634-13584_t